MRPGDVVNVNKGPYGGEDVKARINGTDGYFFHIQILTPTGRKKANGLVSVHRSDLKPLETTSV